MSSERVLQSEILGAQAVELHGLQDILREKIIVSIHGDVGVCFDFALFGTIHVEDVSFIDPSLEVNGVWFLCGVDQQVDWFLASGARRLTSIHDVVLAEELGRLDVVTFIAETSSEEHTHDKGASSAGLNCRKLDRTFLIIEAW